MSKKEQFSLDASRRRAGRQQISEDFGKYVEKLKREGGDPTRSQNLLSKEDQKKLIKSHTAIPKYGMREYEKEELKAQLEHSAKLMETVEKARRRITAQQLHKAFAVPDSMLYNRPSTRPINLGQVYGRPNIVNKPPPASSQYHHFWDLPEPKENEEEPEIVLEGRELSIGDNTYQLSKEETEKLLKALED